ncbi:MAG: hypothetical protein HY259_03345 [Chloroflexi bacterium]|nr:hypothetical protein [Chloroflexota bacterium]MBI3732476.1 hypothetical protein [Chloroflexota bacterium]
MALSDTTALSERDPIIYALKEAGLIVSLAEGLRRMIDPNLDYEAIRKELAQQVFDPPLSELIIQNRGLR